MSTTEELNALLTEAGAETIKDVNPLPERTAYLQHLQQGDRSDKDWVKKLLQLQKAHVLAFHKYVADVFPHLLFETGDDKTYWLYNTDTGVYDEVTALTIKEKTISLLIKDGLEKDATEKQAKDILARFRAMYPDRGVTYDSVDAEGDWVHCKNGWVNVVTKEFKPHIPGRLSRRVSNVAYDTKAICPKYDKFLDEDARIKADQVRVIDQFSGLLLTKDMTKQKMLVIIGKPGSGKSTLLNIWMNVHGQCAMQRQLGELSSDSARFSGNEYVGRNLCWFDEVDVKRSEMSNTLGNLITGATINVERKGVTGISAARNTVRCVLTANNLPMSAEQGIYRRIIYIPFSRSFYDEGTQIDNLLELMLQESSGILNRMLRGLDDLRTLGKFAVIQGHDDAIEAYKVSSDAVAEFLDTFFVPDTSDKECKYESRMIFDAYKKYVGDRMSGSLTPQRFGRLIANQPLDKFKHIEGYTSHGKRYWTGLRLSDDYEVIDDRIVNRNSDF